MTLLVLHWLRVFFQNQKSFGIIPCAPLVVFFQRYSGIYYFAYICLLEFNFKNFGLNYCFFIFMSFIILSMKFLKKFGMFGSLSNFQK